MSLSEVREIVSTHVSASIFDHVIACYFDIYMGLLCAAAAGELSEIKYLVSIGVDVHTDNDYALQMAASCNQYEAVQYFLSMDGAPISTKSILSCLCYLIRNNHIKMLEYIMSRYDKFMTEECWKTMMVCAARYGNDRAAHIIMQKAARGNAHTKFGLIMQYAEYKQQCARATNPRSVCCVIL